MTTTVLYLRGMSRELVREAKSVAAREGVTLAKLVSSALAKTLGAADSTDGLEAELRWFEANEAKLLVKYPGETLAILEQRVVDHDHDFEALAERVYGTYGARAIFMPKLGAGAMPVRRVRSPKLSRA